MKEKTGIEIFIEHQHRLLSLGPCMIIDISNERSWIEKEYEKKMKEEKENEDNS